MKKVLLVDDDADDRDLFREALHEIDPTIEYIALPNAHKAIDHLLKASLPDYIFLDLNMPVMNGKQCLQWIRANELFSDSRVVMFSTTRIPRDLIECTELGADFFFVKPTSFTLIKYSLEMILIGSTVMDQEESLIHLLRVAG